MYVGLHGHGTLTHEGGTTTLTGNMYIGNSSDGTGLIELSGGTLSADWMYVGRGGDGTFRKTGGTVTCSQIHVGTVPGGAGLVFDPFSGLGTTALAAMRLGVCSLCVEIVSGRAKRTSGGQVRRGHLEHRSEHRSSAPSALSTRV